jgi:cold shock protein
VYPRRPTFFRTDDAPTGRRVEAKVKWFNTAKGFGFVTLADGTPDAFLPMAALRRAGVEEVREGAAITCEIGTGAKGPLVVAVLAVDQGSAAPSRGSRASAGHARRLDGALRFFDADKGYGFITPDGGGKDIFLHVTALHRSGLAALAAGQRVRVDVVDGRRGQEADRVALI